MHRHHAGRKDPAAPAKEGAKLFLDLLKTAPVDFAKTKVIVMDMNEQRLEFCRSRMGVADTVLARGKGTEAEALKALIGGHLADLVVDATGNNQSMSQCLQYAAFAGRVVYVGITQQEVSFPHAPVMHRRELTLMGSRNALPADFRRIIDLIREGKIDTRPWITHRTKFEEVIERFPSYTRPETGVIKAIIEV